MKDQFPLRAALPVATSRVLSAASRGPIARAAAKTLTAGETLDEALTACRQAQEAGYAVALRPLLDVAHTPDDIVATRDAFATAMDELASFNTPAPADLTIDLAQFGVLSHDVRPELLIAALRELGQKSRNTGVTITLTVSEPAVVEAVYVLAAELRQDFPEVGVVVPARLRRGADDIAEQAKPGYRVRLDFGRLDAAIGLTSARESGNAYVDAAKQLLRAGARVEFDTDDALLLDISASLAERFETPAEVVGPWGTLTTRQKQVSEHGMDLRVLIPYGPQQGSYVAALMAARPSLAVSVPNLFRRR